MAIFVVGANQRMPRERSGGRGERVRDVATVAVCIGTGDLMVERDHPEHVLLESHEVPVPREGHMRLGAFTHGTRLGYFRGFAQQREGLVRLASCQHQRAIVPTKESLAARAESPCESALLGVEGGDATRGVGGKRSRAAARGRGTLKGGRAASLSSSCTAPARGNSRVRSRTCARRVPLVTSGKK